MSASGASRPRSPKVVELLDIADVETVCSLTQARSDSSSVRSPAGSNAPNGRPASAPASRVTTTCALSSVTATITAERPMTTAGDALIPLSLVAAGPLAARRFLILRSRSDRRGRGVRGGADAHITPKETRRSKRLTAVSFVRPLIPYPFSTREKGGASFGDRCSRSRKPRRQL